MRPGPNLVSGDICPRFRVDAQELLGFVHLGATVTRITLNLIETHLREDTLRCGAPHPTRLSGRRKVDAPSSVHLVQQALCDDARSTSPRTEFLAITDGD